MAITSRRDFRVPAVCLLLLAGAFITSRDPSLTALASPSCTTPDPFVALGGGVCLNGGWVPKGMVPDAQVPPPPPVTAPLPSAPAAPSTCSTPDPFVALGGG